MKQFLNVGVSRLILQVEFIFFFPFRNGFLTFKQVLHINKKLNKKITVIGAVTQV